MDTLLEEPEITQQGDKIISFAPSEGDRPLGLFIDKDSEFLSFLLFTVANVELITAKDLYLFTIVPFVNGNYGVKIDELRSVFQIYFTS